MSEGLIKSTVVTGGMTLISRITGMVRDVIFARVLGASAGVSADAFYVAFAIPNFFRRIFGEGAFSQSFVPVFSDIHRRRGEAEARDFVSHMGGSFALVLFAVTLAGVAAAPLLVMVLAPGFIDDADKFAITVDMLRITFPYLMFISLVAMAAGVLNSRGRFAAAAFTPVLLNVCMIGAALFAAPYFAQPVTALAWGVFAAGVVQLLFQLPFLLRLGMLPRPRLRLRGMHEGVRRVFRLMGPAIFGSSVAQVNLLVNRLLASFLVTGSVSWLYYSDRLMEFPLGVFGVALATVVLPSLSRLHSDASGEEFSSTLDWALRWVFIIALPATVALIVLAQPILITLFHYGKFNEFDVLMTARALIAFALGLTPFILVKILAAGFYARHDTRTPAKIAVVAFLCNIALSLALVFPLKHVGLALAISLAAFVNAGLLFVLLRRRAVFQPQPGWAGFLGKVGLATAVMGGIIASGLPAPTRWLEAGIFERAWRLSFWVATGILIYGAGLWLTGIRLRDVMLIRADKAVK